VLRRVRPLPGWVVLAAAAAIAVVAGGVAAWRLAGSHTVTS
jgi:hypothetical protein